MKVPEYLTDTIHKMTFCSAAVTENFVVLFADEHLYNFVGQQIGICFTDNIHPDYAEEFKEVFHSVLPHTSARTITMMRDSTGLYHMLDIIITNNMRTLRDKPVWDLTIFNICSVEARHIKFIDDINKCRTYLSLYHDYLFDYDPETHIISIFLYMERKATVLKKCSIDEFKESVLAQLKDAAEIDEFNIFCNHITSAIGDFSCKITLPSLTAQPGLNKFEVHGKILIKYNQNPIVQGVFRPTDEGYVPFYATREAHDPGTSLLNKRACYEYTKDTLTVQKNQKHYMAVIDIDNFKSINDTYGHLYGDEVISTIATILSNSLNGRGIIGRFGGDEFYLFTNNIETEEALRIFLTTARQQIRYTFEKRQIDLQVTLSIGVSLYPKDGTSYEELFKKADKCLYIAKNKGKNRYIIYDEEKHGSMETETDVLRTTSNPTEQAEYLAAVLADIGVTVFREGIGCLSSVFECICTNFEVDGIRIYCGEDLKTVYDTANYKRIPDISHILQDEDFLKFYNKNNALVISLVSHFEANNREFCNLLSENNIVGTASFYFTGKDGNRIFFFYDIFNHSIRWNESVKNYLLALSKIISGIL